MAIDFTRAVISIGLRAINRRLIAVVSCACVLLLMPAIETRSQQRSISVDADAKSLKWGPARSDADK